MIGVAINENVYIEKVVKAANRQSLEFTFGQVGDKPMNLFEESMGSKVKDVNTGDTVIRLWAFKVPTFKNADNSERTDAEKRASIGIDITETKNRMVHILQRYMLTDQIEFDQYVGTGIDKTNWEDKWLDDNSLLEMFSVLCDQFIAQINPFIGDKELLSRLKLVRQATDKPFATFPGARYLSSNPFYEAMDVPADRSLIKFSDYEKKKGLASADIPLKSDADTLPDATPDDAGDVFGRRG